MHLIEPIRLCIDKILCSIEPGLKSMILDSFTAGVVGSGYSRSDMILREVFLFENIVTLFESDERLNFVKCIVVLRPSKDNIEQLCRELHRPHYKAYHLYFTSRIGQLVVKKLAKADTFETVRCVYHFPLDFQPITPFLFSLKLDNKTYDLTRDDWCHEGLKRSCDGLISVLLALKMQPLIRYQTKSNLCKALADHVATARKAEASLNKAWRESAPFDVNSLLLIVDRRSDLITPLVNKWTYYAMIHELIGINNNRVVLANFPNRKANDPDEMLLSMENDQFFDDNYYKNFGELAPAWNSALRELKDTQKSQFKIETMDDMKRFIDEYPETKRFTSNIYNHGILMTELSRIINEYNLFEISGCEQELACDLSSNDDIIKKSKSLISNTGVRPIDALRLTSLYAVCRMTSKRVLSDMIKLLKGRKDVSADEVEFVAQLREFSLFKSQNPIDEKVKQMSRKLVHGVKGIENVLTQYKPDIYRILDELTRGNKLREAEFAFHGDRYKLEPPKRIIVFMVGGATYDEAMIIDQFNRSYACQVVLGGTSVHNFSSFMREVQDAFKKQS